MPTISRLILGSQSPRRVDLMREAGFVYEVIPAEVEEAMDVSLSPPALTCANASLKAQHVSALYPDGLVIGADTLVYLDEQPLGKPADLDEAHRMVTSLAGRTHQVCTGVALVCQDSGVDEQFHVITNVTFKPLSEAEIRVYLTKIHPLDKAGGYAAQEHGDLILEAVLGSWSNVVGLPMDELAAQLAKHGVYPAS